MFGVSIASLRDADRMGEPHFYQYIVPNGTGGPVTAFPATVSTLRDRRGSDSCAILLLRI